MNFEDKMYVFDHGIHDAVGIISRLDAHVIAYSFVVGESSESMKCKGSPAREIFLPGGLASGTPVVTRIINS